jgi:hypothetical protein
MDPILCDTFLIQNGLEQRVPLSPLLFNVISVHAVRKVQEAVMKWNWSVLVMGISREITYTERTDFIARSLV